MESLLLFTKENYEWVFSGAGIFLLTVLYSVFFKRESRNINKQVVKKTGDNSKLYMAGRDINKK